MRLLWDRCPVVPPGRSRQEHDLETTFDAEYIAVTKLQADALVTIDPALAAKAAQIVPVAPVAALSVD